MVPMLVASCASDGCTNTDPCVPIAQFYDSSTESTISVDSVSIYGIGAPGDSMIVSCSTVSSFNLPLRTSVTHTDYVIHYDQSDLNDPLLNDTISFDYVINPVFDNNECGVYFSFDITAYSCTSHLVDSIDVPYSHISNLGVTAVKLFMKTQTTDDDSE